MIPKFRCKCKACAALLRSARPRAGEHAAPRFVSIVEDELAFGTHLHGDWMSDRDVFDTEAIREVVAEDVAPLRGRGIDTVVLGCTHFPLLAEPIRRAMGDGVRVVSSAEETSREVREILTRRGELADADSPVLGAAGEPTYRFATTSDDITSFAVAGKFIFGHALDSIEYIELDTLEGMAADIDADAPNMA